MNMNSYAKYENFPVQVLKQQEIRQMAMSRLLVVFKNRSQMHRLNIVQLSLNIGIKHGFSCINIRQVLLEVLKTEAKGCCFQHLPRDLAIVKALKNHVRSLLLYKNWKHLLHFALFLELFCFAFSQMSREHNFH